MDVGAPRPRGSYAKGLAKREEILQRALDVIAREGYRGASVKELANAVGLSQAGLLHYFGSKEELFTEILRKRDERDVALIVRPSSPSRSAASDDPAQGRRGYVDVIRHNAEVPGLVHLFSRLSVDAVDPDHPAHDYFAERSARLRAATAAAVAAQQADGTLDDRVAPETIARLIQAVADGIQVQWMMQPEIDMAAVVDAVFTLLTVRTPDPEEPS